MPPPNARRATAKPLYKSTAIVGAMTLLSRVLGFVRDMIFAGLFGAGPATDAFFVAFKLPNVLRRLFAEGAFAQAFVPVLADYRAHGDHQQLTAFIDRMAAVLATALLTITAAGIVTAPLLATLFAPGFVPDPARFGLTIEMLRITLPYLFFVSLTAFAGSLLNTFERFAVPAFTPVILNVCLISAAIWFAPATTVPMRTLAWAVFIAGLLQLLFQTPFLARLGLMPRLRRPDFRHTGVRRVIGTMLPAIVGVSTTQINLVIDTLIASFLSVGSISWLYYSERLVEFPLGVIGIALATVILPGLAYRHAAGQRNAFSSSLDWAIRWVVLIAFPATAGLVLLAEPIAATLFRYDRFTDTDLHMTAGSLAAYAIGLPGLIALKILIPGFTARHDMRTPVRIGAIAMLANLLLNIVLAVPLAHVGLALATSLSAFLNAGLLLHQLLRRRIYRPRPGWLSFLARVSAATVALTSLLFFCVDRTAWSDWNAFDRAWRLTAWIIAGFTLYCTGLLAGGMRPQHLVLHSSDLQAGRPTHD